MFEDLQRFERKVHSQNGEDGVLAAIFEAIGTTNRVFAEIGCGNATECNAIHLFEQGWSGLFLDHACESRHALAKVFNEHLTRDNVNAIFRQYAVPETFDLLSIDVDGNDFWIWQALAWKPRVVVIEYNSHTSPHERKSIAYDPDFRWSGTDYFGASLRALAELGDKKQFELVYCESTGVNSFFVARDALPPGFVPRAIDAIYRPPNFFGQGIRHPQDADRVMIDPYSGIEDRR